MSKPDLYNEVRKIAIKQDNLMKATQITYKMLKHTSEIPRLPLEYYNITINHRLRVLDNQNEYNTKMIEDLISNPLDRVIIYELAINGDISRPNLKITLKNNFEVIMPRTTLFEHLEKLVKANWLGNYNVSSGSGGAPILFYFFKGIGERCNISLNLRTKQKLENKPLRW